MTSGYPPLPEPFSEALGEAAHTAAMAYRLVLAISDVVRRAAQKRLTGREEELGEDAGLPQVSLGIIATRAPRPLWSMESFTVYDDVQVGIELLSARVTITAPGEIATYERAFADLAAHAVHGAGARTLIRRAATAHG